MTKKRKELKKKPSFEHQIRELTIEMWETFNRSPEDREFVLNGLDEFKEMFPQFPEVGGYFENVKQAFLKAEAKK